MIDRRRVALIGLAVGDALGAAIEFSRPGSFAPVTGYRGGGPHGLRAGEWTDDTSMALALADSMAEGGWDVKAEGGVRILACPLPIKAPWLNPTDGPRDGPAGPLPGHLCLQQR
jgi:ADP-ribosylglycohydrolase